MLKIRLSRYGKKNSPTYRIVVKEARSKRDGVYLDLIGYYNPSSNPVLLEIDYQKISDWTSKGAQITTGLKKVLDLDKSKSKKSTAKASK